MRTDRLTDGRVDVMELIFAFRVFVVRKIYDIGIMKIPGSFCLHMNLCTISAIISGYYNYIYLLNVNTKTSVLEYRVFNLNRVFSGDSYNFLKQ
jgi:hypothetical protein